MPPREAQVKETARQTISIYRFWLYTLKRRFNRESFSSFQLVGNFSSGLLWRQSHQAMLVTLWRFLIPAQQLLLEHHNLAAGPAHRKYKVKLNRLNLSNLYLHKE